MSAPDKCPKCGEEIMHYGHRFRLAGERSEERCLKVQRDQLATKLAELESTYAECAEKLYCAEQREHVLKRRLEYYTGQRDKLVERVNRLKEAGRELCKRHLLVVVTYPKAQADVAAYEKAIQ